MEDADDDQYVSKGRICAVKAKGLNYYTVFV